MNRMLVVFGEDGSEYEFKFNWPEMKDSEAFKHMICDSNPGDNYTVVFKNITKR